MIEREVGCLNPAILAAKAVAPKNSTAREFEARVRAAHGMCETNHRGAREPSGRSLDKTASVHNDLGFTGGDQHNSTVSVTNVERLEILVEYKDLTTHYEQL